MKKTNKRRKNTNKNESFNNTIISFIGNLLRKRNHVKIKILKDTKEYKDRFSPEGAKLRDEKHKNEDPLKRRINYIIGILIKRENKHITNDRIYWRLRTSKPEFSVSKDFIQTVRSGFYGHKTTKQIIETITRRGLGMEE